MDRMLARAQTIPAQIEEHTTESMLRRYILENSNVTNDQILAMERVRLNRISASPGAQAAARSIAPNYESLPSHQLGVGLLHAATGLDRAALSRQLPDIGLTGSARIPIAIARIPRSTREQQTTALHDFTSILTQRAHVQLNRPVWGNADLWGSAAASYLGLPE